MIAVAPVGTGADGSDGRLQSPPDSAVGVIVGAGIAVITTVIICTGGVGAFIVGRGVAAVDASVVGPPEDGMLDCVVGVLTGGTAAALGVDTRASVAVWVGAGVAVGQGVGVGVCVLVGRGVGVRVIVGVGMLVGRGVA